MFVIDLVDDADKVLSQILIVGDRVTTTVIVKGLRVQHRGACVPLASRHQVSRMIWWESVRGYNYSAVKCYSLEHFYHGRSTHGQGHGLRRFLLFSIETKPVETSCKQQNLTFRLTLAYIGLILRT